MSRETLTTTELHSTFIEALGNNVVWHSQMYEKPLDLNLKSPLPNRVRLYMYNATNPPGGRTLGEYKIQLIVPNQKRGERGNFNLSNDRFLILCGYSSINDVFIFWEPNMYKDFSYSRNVQVKGETIYHALGSDIAYQTRFIRGKGIETVIASSRNMINECLIERLRIDGQNLVNSNE